MPTPLGELRVVVYRRGHHLTVPPGTLIPAQDEHMAIVVGEPEGAEDVLCRVHSECWTGETLGSMKCDCRAQLDAALEAMRQAGRGVVVYLRQEGRGIGLGNKIRAYALQRQGADTVEANVQLGFEPDQRTFEAAAAVLQDLRIGSVALMTNNPDKLRELTEAGVRVLRRVPHWVVSHEHSQEYLAVKRRKLGHHA